MIRNKPVEGDHGFGEWRMVMEGEREGEDGVWRPSDPRGPSELAG